MKSTSNNLPEIALVTEDVTVTEIDLNDEDIIDAMRHISGYLDISTDDFRSIYHLAHQHAVGRLVGKVKAEYLMRTGIEPLLPDMYLDEAAKNIVRSGLKGLPVVDEKGCVIGILTETDYLRRLKVGSFLELLLGILVEGFELYHRCHETRVEEAMTTPAVTLTRDAGFQEVVRAFHHHDGRSTPIVDTEGRLLGILLREDFFAALHKEVPK